MIKQAIELLQGARRFASGLRGYLSETLDVETAKDILRRQLESREASFLRLLEFGVYRNPRSPYRRLLEHAGFSLEDIQAIVGDLGLDGALARLYEAGVYVTLDEFKGRTPVKRPGLKFAVNAGDFDNGLLNVAYSSRTGASRGGGTRVPIDFDFIAYETAGMLCNMEANGVAGRPIALWQASPPSFHGLKNVFRGARMGRMPAKWFSPSKAQWTRQGLQGRALLWYTVILSRLMGRGMPRPVYIGPERLLDVVRWLAEMAAKGQPALVFCFPSPAVRACLLAEQAGTDISGTVFYGGGEAYTEGKQAVQERAGVRHVSNYAMSESGTIAFQCGARTSPDEMHVLSDKMAVLQRPKELESGAEVGALYHTSLLTTTPKLMLNVESGDYAVLEERDCGCLWQRMGFTTHISRVRSYEKLTSEGVMFMGSMLYELLEQTLPARFGGSPLDYQLVEQEEDGVPQVSIVVSPRIGAVPDEAVIDAVLGAVGFADWSRRMADSWRHAGTLRVERREPYSTSASKLLPLHVIVSGAKAAEPSGAAPAGAKAGE
jgi:hypothetical protein